MKNPSGDASNPPQNPGYDLDDDLDVDQDDFGILQSCMSGSGVPAPADCPR